MLYGTSFDWQCESVWDTKRDMRTSTVSLLGCLWVGFVSGFGCSGRDGGQSGTDAFEVEGHGIRCETNGQDRNVGEVVTSECSRCVCQEDGAWDCQAICPVAPSPDPDAEVCLADDGSVVTLGDWVLVGECTQCYCVAEDTFNCRTESDCSLVTSPVETTPAGPQAPTPQPDINAPSPDVVAGPNAPSPGPAVSEPPPSASEPATVPANPAPTPDDARCYAGDGSFLDVGQSATVDVCTICNCVEPGVFSCEVDPSCGNAPSAPTPGPVAPSGPGLQPSPDGAWCFAPDGTGVQLNSWAQLDECLSCQCVDIGTFQCSTSSDCTE